MGIRWECEAEKQLEKRWDTYVPGCQDIRATKRDIHKRKAKFLYNGQANRPRTLFCFSLAIMDEGAPKSCFAPGTNYPSYTTGVK